MNTKTVRNQKPTVRDRKTIDKPYAHAPEDALNGCAVEPPQRPKRWWYWLIPLSALSLIYVSAMMHAGFLCGDETCAVHLSRMSPKQLYQWILFDSYPMAWPLVLKAYTALFGSSDISIRLLGLSVQVGILTSVIVFARKSNTIPLYTTTCLLFLPAFVNHTSSARAWGLGILTITMFYTSINAYVANASRRDFLLSIAFGVFAVQSTYYNSVLLFAILVSIAAFHRQLIPSLLLIGAVCGATMLPYIPVFTAAHSHYADLHVKYGLADFLAKLSETLFPDTANIFRLGWVIAIGFGLYSAWKSKNFAEILLIAVAIICYYAFLLQLHYQTNPWYYLPLVAVVALALDRTAGRHHPKYALAMCAVVIVLEFPFAYRSSTEAQTNMNLILDDITARAADGDLVVLSPWHAGELFNYYYKGKGELLAVPNIPVNQMFVTRWDLERDWIETNKVPDVTYTVDRIRRTLASGHTAFVVSSADWGYLHKPAPTLPEINSAMPNLPLSFYYSFVLNEQLVNFVQSPTLGATFSVMNMPREGVSQNAYFNLALLAAAPPEGARPLRIR